MNVHWVFSFQGFKFTMQNYFGTKRSSPYSKGCICPACFSSEQGDGGQERMERLKNPEDEMVYRVYSNFINM